MNSGLRAIVAVIALVALVIVPLVLYRAESPNTTTSTQTAMTITTHTEDSYQLPNSTVALIWDNSASPEPSVWNYGCDSGYRQGNTFNNTLTCYKTSALLAKNYNTTRAGAFQDIVTAAAYNGSSTTISFANTISEGCFNYYKLTNNWENGFNGYVLTPASSITMSGDSLFYTVKINDVVSVSYLVTERYTGYYFENSTQPVVREYLGCSAAVTSVIDPQP